jgi:hypothetical protein
MGAPHNGNKESKINDKLMEAKLRAQEKSKVAKDKKIKAEANIKFARLRAISSKIGARLKECRKIFRSSKILLDLGILRLRRQKKFSTLCLSLYILAWLGNWVFEFDMLLITLALTLTFLIFEAKHRLFKKGRPLKFVWKRPVVLPWKTKFGPWGVFGSKVCLNYIKLQGSYARNPSLDLAGLVNLGCVGFWALFSGIGGVVNSIYLAVLKKRGACLRDNEATLFLQNLYLPWDWLDIILSYIGGSSFVIAWILGYLSFSLILFNRGSTPLMSSVVIGINMAYGFATSALLFIIGSFRISASLYLWKKGFWVLALSLDCGASLLVTLIGIKLISAVGRTNLSPLLRVGLLHLKSVYYKGRPRPKGSKNKLLNVFLKFKFTKDLTKITSFNILILIGAWVTGALFCIQLLF